jgi:ectoine hydroxylase-related dioxygenase (phytanoyl-CoA dioxygenase family)
MPYDPCVNIWIPLVSVGQDRPSLELIPNTFSGMRVVPPLLAYNAGRTDEWIHERFPNYPTMVAVLNPGDAVLFDHFTLHRTQPMTTQAGPRVSGEFRVTLTDRRGASQSLWQRLGQYLTAGLAWRKE